MVEEFICGREITVGIVDGKALPIIEIRSRANFYDYHAKYESDATEYLFDTIEDPVLAATIQTMALTCFHELGCRHLGRVDFILAGSGTAYILEINTLPGFTSHSLLPMAAQKAGIDTPQLCRQIVEVAWTEHQSKISNLKPETS
jgi:D-alanine-D-alanine ligase